MDNFELYEGEDLYEDEALYADEEEAAEGEGANRTFIIIVGILGGLFLLTLCVFLVWAFVINPRMAADRLAQNQAIEATNEALLAGTEMTTPTVTIPPTETQAPVATDTPSPTKTEPPTATTVRETPTVEVEEEVEATEVAAVVATPSGPTPTSRPTATPRPVSTKVPGTGIGALGGGALAVGLLFLLAMVRRLRRAA